jgi:hypothetical protein
MRDLPREKILSGKQTGNSSRETRAPPRSAPRGKPRFPLAAKQSFAATSAAPLARHVDFAAAECKIDNDTCNLQ